MIKINSYMINVWSFLKKFTGWWVFVLLVSVIYLFALYLRFNNLISFPIFADEAIYIRWAQVMQAEPTLRFLPLSDGKQPLFMWVIIPFFKYFRDPLFAGRIVSAIAGLFSLTGIGVLTWFLFRSKKQIIIAMGLYCIVPFIVFFERMALVDAMLSMFGIWVLIGGILLSQSLRLDIALITGFILGCAWLTKSPALFFTIMFPLSWIMADWRKEMKRNIFLLGKLLLLTSIVFLISFSMFNLLRLGPNFQMLSSRNMDYVFPIKHIWENPMDPLLPHIKDVFDWLVKMGTWPFILLIFMGTIIGLKKKTKPIFLMLLWTLTPLFIQCLYAKVFTARYILFTLPTIIVISSAWIWAKSLYLKIFGLIVLIVLLPAAFVQNFRYINNPLEANLPRSERSGYLEEWTSGYGIKDVADYLRKLLTDLPSQERIVVGTEGYFGTLPDGLQIYFNNVPRITIIGVEIIFREIPKPLLEAKKAGNRVYLLANDTRIEMNNPEDYGLELIRQFPKGLRATGTKEYNVSGPRESLMFFELQKVVK